MDRGTTDETMSTGERAAIQHPTSEDVAAYLDGALTGAAKARFQDHLSRCDECRLEVSERPEQLHAGSNRRRWTIAAPAAAAAAAVVLLIAGPLARDADQAPVGAVRGPEASAEREAVPTVELLEPAPLAEVIRGRLVFRWEAVASEALYRITVTDERGDPVWSDSTSRTSVAPPSEAELELGRVYYWYLDALLPDGRTYTAELRSFSLRP